MHQSEITQFLNSSICSGAEMTPCTDMVSVGQTRGRAQPLDLKIMSLLMWFRIHTSKLEAT